MKTKISYLCAVLLLVAGCRKEDSTPPAPSRNLTAVSGVPGFGSFSYQDGLLTGAGGYQITYQDGQIAGMRREWRDTGWVISVADSTSWISHSVTRYSFRLLEQGEVRACTLDSSFQESGSPGSPASVSLYSEPDASAYFYHGDRLDSVVYVMATPGSLIREIINAYDGKGNIRTQTVFMYPHNLLPGQPLPAHTNVSVTTFEYDHHPNPWNLLFRQTGVLLPGLELYNISQNNPVRSTSVVELGNQEIRVESTYHYVYDAEGYPVKATSSAGGSVLTFTYDD